MIEEVETKTCRIKLKLFYSTFSPYLTEENTVAVMIMTRLRR